jgi:hypothetical protein
VISQVSGLLVLSCLSQAVNKFQSNLSSLFFSNVSSFGQDSQSHGDVQGFFEFSLSFNKIVCRHEHESSFFEISALVEILRKSVFDLVYSRGLIFELLKSGKGLSEKSLFLGHYKSFFKVSIFGTLKQLFECFLVVFQVIMHSELHVVD